MKRIASLIVLLLCYLSTAKAQVAGGNCVGFVSNIESNATNLDSQHKESLKLKVDQIISRNKVATTALYNAFIITPYIDIISLETINSGLRPVTTAVAEFTLIASNSVDQSIYGSVTVEVKASANSESQAMTNIISSLRPTDPRFTKFISTAVSQITSYYSDNMPTILRKTETLISASEYGDAITFLESIPTCVPSYEQSSEAIQQLYKMVADKDCYVAITKAERHISLGEFDEAKEILMSVKVGSDCDPEVSKLIAIVGDSLKSQEPIEIVAEEEDSDAIPPELLIPKVEYIVVDPNESSEPAQPKGVSTGNVTSNFANFDVSLSSVSTNANDNTVIVTLLVRNKSELSYGFSIYRYNSSTFLYNDSGDTFYCSAIDDYNFTLQAGMPRKVSLTFTRIPSSNTTLSGVVGARDGGSGEGTIKITNLDIKW